MALPAGARAVTADHLKALDERQLQELLNRLLRREAMQYSIPLGCIHATDPVDTKAADGGIDARVEWTGGISRTDFLTTRHTLFQSKATDMPPAKCASEVLEKQVVKSPRKTTKGRGAAGRPRKAAGVSAKVLPAIVAALSTGGSYVLFCNRSAPGSKRTDRIDAIYRMIRKELPRLKVEQIDFYDTAKIREWVNQYGAVAVWVHEQLGVATDGFQTVEHWAGNPDVTRTKFATDAEVIARLADIRRLIPAARRVGRIVGLSGLGKTRQAFEAFRPPKDPSADPDLVSLSESVLYRKMYSDGPAVVQAVRAMRDSGFAATLIVDDCDQDTHRALSEIVGHSASQLRLLTIDHDVPHDQPSPDVVKLGPLGDALIKGIVKEQYPALDEAVLDRITEFAGGYPQMAVLLGDSSLNSVDAAFIAPGDLAARMIWGRTEPEATGTDAMRVCSLFSVLGISGESKSEGEYAAKLANLPIGKFLEWVNRFVAHGIVRRRNRYIQVQPKPLALRLCGRLASRPRSRSGQGIVHGRRDAPSIARGFM